MRYIITKERILDLTNWELDCETKDYLCYLFYDENGQCQDGVCINKEDIIKQADIIDGLCDRYVLHGIDIIHIDFKNKKYCFEGEWDKWFDITDIELRKGIYGAIWTSKGLIYVIKMNVKCEFELYEKEN